MEKNHKAVKMPPEMENHTGMSVEAIKKSFWDNLKYRLVKEDQTATHYDLFLSLAYAIRDRLVENWVDTQRFYRTRKVKRVYYLSLEFLIGRTLGNSVINLQIEDHVTKALQDMGFSLEDLREAEIDAGLGNGGLGRLAACFMDSLSTLGVPADGYGIRYDYGIFNQEIDTNGAQLEKPDEWLTRTYPWEVFRSEYVHKIQFGGRVIEEKDEKTGKPVKKWVGTDDVLAVAYDTPIPGFGNRTVNNLRLWSARATEQFHLDFFNKGDYFKATSEKTQSETISKVLYPNDNSPQGRELRLKQQYFFVSASIQDILRRVLRDHGSLEKLPSAVSIQLNDTHPAIAIVEFMRQLIDVHGMEWDKAWEMTRAIFAYTNHTLMPEALEKWSLGLFGRLFPRHLEIAQQINALFLKEVAKKYPDDNDRLRRMSIFEDNHESQIRMAYLAIVGSHSVNGVSALHTDLLKSTVVPDLYEMFPERFNNKTNGITQRRWLRKCNLGLGELITSKIGKDWVTDLEKLKGLEKYADDKEFRKKWREVKSHNKKKLAAIIRAEHGFEADLNSMFDVQVKRIHEYKRQLLNALRLVALYNRVTDDPKADIVPRTVLFGGKAAPDYAQAKLIIRFINAVAKKINHDPKIGGKLKVAFLANYRVSLAEKIIPATDLSEQISTAGKEASGTGNMKFALNGALTIGTLDGANIEILEEVGEDNIFIFGLKADEVARMKKEGYRPQEFCGKTPELKRVMDMIAEGFFSSEDPGLFRPLFDSLMYHDEYMLMADFDAYMKCQDRVDALFRDKDQWTRMAILNVARMGKFSSDRTILEYCKDIWKIKPVKIE